jgi:hypothetical protein
MTEQKFDTEGKNSLYDFPMAKFEKFIRNQIAIDLEKEAIQAVISNEYSFNDTAIRAKTYYHASEIARGKYLSE